MTCLAPNEVSKRWGNLALTFHMTKIKINHIDFLFMKKKISSGEDE